MNARHDEPATKGDLDQLKHQLITKIDANSAKIEANGVKIDANGTKIEANSKKIDANGAKIEANGKKIDANGTKIEANGKKIDDISATLNRLTSLVLDNRERMATKEEMNRRLDEIIKGQDKMMVVLLRVDQERAATNARIDRVEGDVDTNKNEIKRIKTKLAMDA
ncbi:hypothetical protein J7K60_00795 [Candidatus Bipolaricaulota bacterium]|nr:hypothetical protein [Candidatus Bipolaricaulota bacterium]